MGLAALKPSERWRSLVTYYAERAKLPPDLCFRQMMAESAADPKARSPVGALGLFQIMPSTAADLNIDPLDPDQACDGGTRYDAKQLALVCSVLNRQWPEPAESPENLDIYRFMLTSYNAGAGYTLTALKSIETHDWPTFSEALRHVVFKGKRPDWKQALGYAEKILPSTGT